MSKGIRGFSWCARYAARLQLGSRAQRYEDMARNVKSDEELFKLSEQTSMFDVDAEGGGGSAKRTRRPEKLSSAPRSTSSIMVLSAGIFRT